MIETQIFAEKLAQKAGKILLAKFGKSKIAVEKGANDFATDADLASEKLIISELRKNFPADGILAEESVADFDSRKRNWVIDPLDGHEKFSFRTAELVRLDRAPRRRRVGRRRRFRPDHRATFFRAEKMAARN